ncbi:hypothetical protein [Gemmatimonas groenlandica]|uniref:Uncharacterized protein n=1 Tax=Gemmatimonas groenlandica TaxID=2732249 RepID=A0A6M4IS52_9BACT|nr:hypothetical protein [Gemmatimonas groenlandica]QJR37573.1 hypothetical protein HKW67_19650 [Gemmatimonas groenlandica]
MTSYMNRNIVRALALFACVLLSACRFGTKPGEIDWVVSPEGARIALRVVGETQDRMGELLSVDNEHVLMRSPEVVEGVELRRPKITRVAWSRVYAIDVDQLGGAYDVVRGQRVAEETRRKLALISRFPQGVSLELLTRLLAADKQAAVEEIK